MPTKREREYYRMGFIDGTQQGGQRFPFNDAEPTRRERDTIAIDFGQGSPIMAKRKRKLSAWNKFVKANSKKKIYRYANGKLKLKKMGIAFRKKKRR